MRNIRLFNPVALMKKCQRVLLIQGPSLLDDGLKSLLKREADLQILSVIYSSGPQFLQEIFEARPDVILLSEADPLDTGQILRLLQAQVKLTDVRLILVRADGNTVDVRERRRYMVYGSNDLLAIIRDGKKTHGENHGVAQQN